MPSLATLLQLLGGATALTISYKLCTFIHLYLRPSSLPRYHHNKPGSSWALITGATDGIGAAFAETLLSSNFNIVLHGRNASKLATMQSHLSSLHPNLEIRTVQADAFDYASTPAIQKIVNVATSLPGNGLTILINNVGGVPIEPRFAPLATMTSEYMDNIINLNLRFPSQLTRALLPLLIKNNPSLIINITSALALRGLPFFTTYSPSKAFNYSFSQTLASELNLDDSTKNKIEVLGIVIFNVTSGGNKDYIPIITCDSAQMAKESLARVGCGRSNVWGWWRHAVQFWCTETLLPGWMVERMVGEELKKRFLLQQQQQQQQQQEKKEE